MTGAASPEAGIRDIAPVIRQVSELRALCLSLREARNRLREEAWAAAFRDAMEGEMEPIPADPRVIRAGLRDLWVRGEYERIARQGKKLLAKVREADETILMCLTCSQDYFRAGPAASKTA